MQITRREFAAGAFAVAGVALIDGPLAIGSGLVRPASGQELSPAELLAPGALPDMIMGAENAPVTIIEYASMTCPHCANFHDTTYPEMKKKYIDTGKVRFIFREFPLDPLAAAGFMLARCGGKEKYFPIIETLFHQQKEWVVQRPLGPLLAIAKQAGFTQQSFEACLNDRELQDKVETVRNHAAQKFGVNSTPSFFINGKKFTGDLTVAELDKQLEPYLKGQ